MGNRRPFSPDDGRLVPARAWNWRSLARWGKPYWGSALSQVLNENHHGVSFPQNIDHAAAIEVAINHGYGRSLWNLDDHPALVLR
jgi:hypothetical protein